MKPITDLDKALYQCDLMQDEFIRISHLTDNSEIKALCERAQSRLKSEISFFDRLEKLESVERKYNAIVAAGDAELDSMVGSIFIELLRSYHDGVGVSHGASPQAEVARELAKEAYFMAIECRRTINKLKGC